MQRVSRHQRAKIVIVTWSMLFAATFSAPGCGDTSKKQASKSATPAKHDTAPAPDRVAKQVLEAVIMPTYIEHQRSVSAMHDKVLALRTMPTFDTLEAARAAWHEARIVWERAEVFTFGPAVRFELDPKLDTWPLDEAAVGMILADSQRLNADAVPAWSISASGYHGVEAAIFGLTGNRNLLELTPQWLVYVELTASLLRQHSDDIAASWDVTYLHNKTYRELFLSSGAPGNTLFPLPTSAVAEIASGIAGLVEECLYAKVLRPFDNQNPALIESYYSDSSLEDVVSNLRGVKDAYVGQVQPADATTVVVNTNSISKIVRAYRPDLDEKILRQMDEAIASVALIPRPFAESLVRADHIGSLLEAAARLKALRETLNGEFLLVLHQYAKDYPAAGA